MKRRCPNLNCSYSILIQKLSPKTKPIIKKGTFYRKTDRRMIRRYECRGCGTRFSSATFSPEYRQKRRDLNHAIFELLCSGVSQKRLAASLQVNPKTVVRKFRQLGVQKRTQHEIWLDRYKNKPLEHVQFDDLETSEHTKCKPVSVTLAVNPKTREILHFQVSRMPAKGLLAKTALKKYGYRKDERHDGWDYFFSKLRPIIKSDATFSSDQNPHYSKHLKKHFKNAHHIRHPGGRGAVTGQAELKKLNFDPLFSLNHTCAMLRANMNRLFRKTWCTTKNIQGLIDHLSLYVIYHNQYILPRLGTIKGGS